MEHLHPLVGEGRFPVAPDRVERVPDVEPRLRCAGMFNIGEREILEGRSRLVVLLQLHLDEAEIKPGLDGLGGVSVGRDELLELLGGEVVHPVVIKIDRQLEIGVFL